MRQQSLFCIPGLVALAVALLGCPSVKYTNLAPVEAGVDGVVAGSGGRTGSGGIIGTTGTGGALVGTDGGATDGACATKSAAAEPLPLDLYLMMDTSRSMLNRIGSGATTDPTKWEAVKGAMTAFFNDSRSAGLGIGIGYFPAVQASLPGTCTADSACATFGPCDRRSTCVRTGNNTTTVVPLCLTAGTCQADETCALIQDCGAPNYCASAGTACPANCAPMAGYCHARDICDPAVYATPAVAIAALPGAAANLVGSLNLPTRMPDGYTPTAPALTGAIQYARQQALATPDHKLAVVLVTDGLPGGFTDLYDTGVLKRGFPRTECDPLDIPGIAAIAAAGAAGAAGAPAIPTFVIGVFSPLEEPVVRGQLDQLARGGGTGAAVLINTTQNVTQLLQTELDKIRSKAIACEYKIPPPAAGTGLDLGKVNVNFVGGGGTSATIPYVPGGKAACDARGGWYYDVDPKADVGRPTSIIACESSCTMFQADLAGRVDIVLGCLTIVIG